MLVSLRLSSAIVPLTSAACSSAVSRTAPLLAGFDASTAGGELRAALFIFFFISVLFDHGLCPPPRFAFLAGLGLGLAPGRLPGNEFVTEAR